MAVSRTTFGGINTDSPPDQLGNGALYLKNLVPSSAQSVRPRPGVDLLKNIGTIHTSSTAQRRINVAAFAGDVNFTTFIVCTNIIVGTDVPSYIEGIFECHLGESVYNSVVGAGGLVSTITLTGTTPGLYLPTAVQFGNRAFVYYPDHRPIVVQEFESGGGVAGIECGIQASVAGPSVIESATNANNIAYDSAIPSLNLMQIGYCYYSSARNVYSQPSPLTTYTIPATPKKLSIAGFFNCRDTNSNYLIDFIVVCVRSGINGGLMAVWPEMAVSIDPVVLAGSVAITSGGFTVTGTLTTFLDPDTGFVIGDTIFIDNVSYTVKAIADNTHLTTYQASTETVSNFTYYRGPRILFDLSPDQLSIGIDLNALAGAMWIPPAVRYCERYGERIWLAAQLQTITFGTTTLTVQKAALDGTLAFTNGSAAIVGTGTNFSGADGQLEPFDTIAIYADNTNDPGNPIQYVVGTINSDTSATMTSAWSPFPSTSNLKAARIFRGNVSARLETNADAFTTAHLYMNVYVEGVFIGQIFDVLNSRTAFLFGDVNTDYSATANWELRGNNDRIFPSSYSTAAFGTVPTVFPECVQLNDYQLLTQALDQGQALTGLLSTLDELRIAFDSSFVRMIGGNETDTPAPNLRQYYGLAGCIAPRSLCKAPSGEMAWIGVEGIFIDAMGTSYAASMSGIKNVCTELGCQALFRGGQWIARADIPNMVMTYSRELTAFIFSNFTINGESGWWGMLAMSPQYGIFLFNNQLVTSNMIEYLNNGRGEILGGDGIGRIKRFLYDKTLVDISPLNTSTAPYTCQWRSGYDGKNNEQWEISRVDPVMIAPDTTTIAGTLDFFRTDFMERESSYLPSGAQYSVAFTVSDLMPVNRVPINPNRARYHSIAVSFLSTAGAVTPANQVCRPMECVAINALESRD